MKEGTPGRCLGRSGPDRRDSKCKGPGVICLLQEQQGGQCSLIQGRGQGREQGPRVLAEQAEHLKICPRFQRYLDDIMLPYLLLLTSCTYISGTGIQPVKQGEPDGSACGHGRCQPVCADGHWAVRSSPHRHGPGSPVHPWCAVSTPGGHTPTWSCGDTASATCGSRTHGPGDSQARSCICATAWIVAPGRCPQRCTSPMGLSENPGEVHGSHSQVPEPRHLGPLPLGGRCGSPCHSNEGTATPGGRGGGGRRAQVRGNGAGRHPQGTGSPPSRSLLSGLKLGRVCP